MPPVSMSSLQKKRPIGLIISLIITILLLCSAIAFGFWAFAEREDYKNNVEPKIAAAVEVAKQENSKQKDAEFAEKEKSPLKAYQGPSAYGSVVINFPKTWSAYVNETGSGGSPLDGYFHPDFVPGAQSGTTFALRLQVTESAYAQEIRQFENTAKQGKARIAAFQAPKVAGATGIRVDGEISQGKQGSMIILPLRDKTLKIFTESNQYLGDFNSHIIPNLTFVP